MEGKEVKSPERNKKKRKNVLFRIIIWLVIIAAVIFLTLFLASRIGKFESIGSMLQWISDQGVSGVS